MNRKRYIFIGVLFTITLILVFMFCKNFIFSSNEFEVESTTVSNKVEKTKNSISQKSNENSSNKPEDFKEEILKNSSENKNMKLVLPVNQQLQEKWYYCAPTTVSMMLDSRGINVNQHELASEMGTYEAFGTHNKDAIRILNKHMFGYEYPANGQSGYRLETVTDVESALPKFQERVIKNIQDGYPMYYTIEISKVYPGKKGEHNVIGIGYKLADNGKDIEELYYIDPLPSVKELTSSTIQTITPRKLLEATIPCVEPNYAW